MIQQSKGSMGLGSFGGQAQMLFGGSGGQDLFQKITWVLAAIFMFGSFGLTLMKHKQAQSSRYLANHKGIVYDKTAATKPQQPSELPAADTQTTEAASQKTTPVESE